MTTTLAADDSERLKPATHLVIALAVAVIAPFTALAWPFALLTGMVIGTADAEKERGVSPRTATTLVRVLAVTGGVLATLFAGAFFGGLIAFMIIALAAFSERAAGRASPTDRGVARILLFVAAAVGWLAFYLVLGLRVNIQVGG